MHSAAVVGMTIMGIPIPRLGEGLPSLPRIRVKTPAQVMNSLGEAIRFDAKSFFLA